jgi:hypothetical protein
VNPAERRLLEERLSRASAAPADRRSARPAG